MFRYILFISCFLTLDFMDNAHGDEFQDIVDTEILDSVDELCEDNEELIEQSIGSPHIMLLRVVEYTEFSTKSHAVFPSAAGSLLRSKNFDPSRRTVIFIHGFTDNPLLLSGQTFAIAYKTHGHHNILALDSSKLIKMFYLRSSALVKYIGEALGGIIYDLVNQGVPLENIHVVGHSLGAHIAGFAGKAFQELTEGIKLPRITGMDPAGPCFVHTHPDNRLDNDDAEFVDVIHTNIGVFGINKSIGHVDFYPNGGGVSQPGCMDSICSHIRVWEFYEESVVKPKAFIATKCDSWESFKHKRCNHGRKVVMGMGTPSSARGEYYLRTNFMFPFGLGDIGSKPNRREL